MEPSTAVIVHVQSQAKGLTNTESICGEVGPHFLTQSTTHKAFKIYMTYPTLPKLSKYNHIMCLNGPGVSLYLLHEDTGHP